MKEIFFAIATIVATDGDTLRHGDVRARIWGLDCPELNTKRGRDARAVAQAWLNANGMTCYDTGQKSYKRSVYKCDAFVRYMIDTGACTEWCRYSKGYYGGSTCLK